nr:reverse transcriptase domain-containing protein [Tanacetum cinerariifolium]
MEAEEELRDPWTLFTDGSSCVDGSRAGLILTNTKGAKFTYALRFRCKKDDKGMSRLLVYRHVPRNPQQKLTPITSPWPFYKWGIDIAGPFSEGPGKVKFLIVAIDYFAKWIKAKPVATITVIPVEIGMHTLRTTEIDMVQYDKALEINLGLLEERREQVAIRESRSKAKMEKYYNSKVCNTSFKPKDLVYRNNDASHAKDSRKLILKWEGPYEVTKALGMGAYKLTDRNEISFYELGTSATSRNVTCMKCYMIGKTRAQSSMTP